MIRSESIPLVVLALALAGQPLAAQQPAIPISGRERGLAEVDGELWAVGATYKARFEPGAVLIVPPLGVDAPRSLPLRLALESIRIGSATVCVGDASAPIEGAFEVRYQRGANVVESYAVRTDALEQSFVLHELPAQRGELVLRLHVDTELVPSAEGAGLYFEGAPGRGLHFGELTAIDARGRRVAGAVRLASGALELVVPADFMATAEAPLLLDPTIGGGFNLHPGPGEVGDPDVTTGVVAGKYFAVFERRFSSTDIDIYGQEFQTDGTFIGPTVIFEPTIAQVAQNPTVATDFFAPPPFGTGIDAYVAVWQQGTTPTATQSVVARPSVPGTGVLIPSVTLGTGSGSHTNPDAASVTAFTFVAQTKVFVVWQQGTEIRGRYLSVNSASAAPTLGATIPISSGLLDSEPAAANSLDHHALVVWRRFFTSPAPGDHDITGALVSNLSETVDDGSVPVSTTLGPDEQHPRIAPGQIAFARAPSSTSADRDIYRASYDSFHSSTPFTVDAPQAVALGSSSNDHDPAIGGNAATALHLAWRHEATGFLGVGINAVGLLNLSCSIPVFCTPDVQLCENVFGVAFSLLNSFADVELTGEMAVYEVVGAGVFAEALAFSGDSSTPLGGGCTGGGAAGKQCPAAVNSNLTHVLTNAMPAQPAFLVLGFDRIDVSCGSCTLIPDPFTGFVIAAGSTDAAGEAEVHMPVPNAPALTGLSFIDQWAVVPGASPCTELGVTLSSATQFTIQ